MELAVAVIKIASRCNINCTYCYMYNLGDSSYKNQPKFISKNTIENFSSKFLNHAIDKSINQVQIVLHGGEPLLMNKSDFKSLLIAFDKYKQAGVKVRFSLQTNGILIDDEWSDIFKEYNVSVGVSLDGPKEFNDENRIDKKGNGTYDNVAQGLNVLKNNNIPFGILSVLNTEINPADFYENFTFLKTDNLDILLLDQNYDTFDQQTKFSYFEWLKIIFDIWYSDTSLLNIRFFDSIIQGVFGDMPSLDSYGTSENKVVVLETNGDLEPVDVLKSCGENFTKTGLNVNDNIEINDVFNHSLIEVYYNSGKYLPKKCLACPVQEICGGGYLPHRYDSKNGFNNPSVYCDDLLKLVTYIQNVVIDGMPEELIKRSGIQKLTYDDALQIIEEILPTIPEPKYIEKLENFRKIEYGIV